MNIFQKYIQAGNRLSSSLVIVVLVGVWELLATGHAYNTTFIPAPSMIAIALYQMAHEGTLFLDLAETIVRVAIGFGIGLLTGFLAGLLTGLVTRADNLVAPILQIARPIPALAIVPLAIVWFGIGEGFKLFIIGWATFFPIWLGTNAGVRQVSKELLWTAALLGADKKRQVLEVVIPSSLSFVQNAARVSLGLGFAATVVAEMSGADAGLGYRIFVNHLVFRPDRMLASLILVGIVGALIDRIYLSFGNWLFPWLRKSSRNN